MKKLIFSAVIASCLLLVSCAAESKAADSNQETVTTQKQTEVTTEQSETTSTAGTTSLASETTETTAAVTTLSIESMEENIDAKESLDKIVFDGNESTIQGTLLQLIQDTGVSFTPFSASDGLLNGYIELKSTEIVLVSVIAEINDPAFRETKSVLKEDLDKIDLSLCDISAVSMMILPYYDDVPVSELEFGECVLGNVLLGMTEAELLEQNGEGEPHDNDNTYTVYKSGNTALCVGCADGNVRKMILLQE